MIQISQLKLRPDHTEEELLCAVRKKLRLKNDTGFSYVIRRQSVDARKKPRIFYVYTVDVKVRKEEQILSRLKGAPDIRKSETVKYRFPSCGDDVMQDRPVVIGSGPGGLFCTWMLSRAGFQPVLLERGGCVSERTQKVHSFWEGGVLDPECNVQFGEGGAGTFSDGKLNTMIKDPQGRIRAVYELFVRHGADPSILYSYKPHIGTDVLAEVIPSIREEIRQMGGIVCFHHMLADFTSLPEGKGYELCVRTPDGEKKIRTQVLVLAIGHSARDTFRMLHRNGVSMEPKAFAVGVRVQHPQQKIDEAMYGTDCPYEMDAAPYKLAASVDGRGIYSFCMCPGGYVINASSQAGALSINGMSTFARDSGSANSAIVVSVSPEQFDAKDPLDGVLFQEKLERCAYEAGKGAIPTQRFSDFREGFPGIQTGSVPPRFKGAYRMTDIRHIFPETIARTIDRGMEEFGRRIRGFDDADTLLSAVESRTSSPVRIIRDNHFESLSHPGIFPCGEGAGYAGGITSAAVDGIRIAERIIEKYRPPAAPQTDGRQEVYHVQEKQI